MLEIIDLSQDIFTGMPVFPSLPQVEITMHASHEEWDGITDSEIVSPAVNRLELGEHTGTHVDAINHMARQFRGQSIDTMPLTMFYTEGICLNLSHKGLRELIETVDLEHALSEAESGNQAGRNCIYFIRIIIAARLARTIGAMDRGSALMQRAGWVNRRLRLLESKRCHQVCAMFPIRKFIVFVGSSALRITRI